MENATTSMDYMVSYGNDTDKKPVLNRSRSDLVVDILINMAVECGVKSDDMSLDSVNKAAESIFQVFGRSLEYTGED